MTDTPVIPELLQCPICWHHERPGFWLCRRVSVRDKVDTYRLHGCSHAAEAGDWACPPNGMSTDRAILANAWNRWVMENSTSERKSTP